jgi:nicotinamide riboside kinase
MEEANSNIKGIRLALTGPESSGKTTLAQAISLFYGGKYVPEYAREFLAGLGRAYLQSDLPMIAQRQFDLNKADDTIPFVVCDTEMTVMRVWYRYSYHSNNALIDTLFQTQRFHHLFLCTPDMPWEPDPLREHPKERMRLFDLYVKELQQQDLPFTIVNGTLEKRMEQVEKVVRSLMN